MSDVNLSFNSIEHIGLNDPNYGGSLNERLDSIDANFSKITNTGFLRGADGKSISIVEWQIGTDPDANLNNDNLLSLLTTAIRSNDQSNGSYAWNPNIEYNGLSNKKIYLICKENEVISSLPFTYIDERFKNLQNMYLEN